MKPSCVPFFERLIDGEKPETTADLARHVGACLDCYRVLSDLGDVPRLSQALRAARSDLPGESFWGGFPARVFEASRAAGGLEVLPAAPQRRGWRVLATTAVGAACLAAAAALFLRVERAPVGSGGADRSSQLGVPMEPDGLADIEMPALASALAMLEGEEGDFFDPEAEAFVEAVDDDLEGLAPLEQVDLLDGETLGILTNSLERSRI